MISRAIESEDREENNLKDTVVEIRNFELYYDGLYHLTWYEDDKEHRWFIHLKITQLLRMIELEGFSMGDIYNAESDRKPLVFKKVVLICSKTDSKFNTEGFTSKYIRRGSTLENDGFNVSLSIGGSVKQHKYDFLLMKIYVKDHVLRFKP